MKKIRANKKTWSVLLLWNILLFDFNLTANAPLIPSPLPSNNIKIGLLLDTSGSMNGLLEQAKSQLWKIVNELALANKNGVKAAIQIALYEYGNDGLSSREGYVKNIQPLTDDLDDISEKLFALSTNGGSEFCGYAIETATNEQQWDVDPTGLNVIFIAGNEPFNQGPKDYKVTCANAVQNGITVNTIFCGDAEQGVRTFWKDGATLTEGSYMNIDMNQKTIYVETPYDNKIDELNTSLNDTYIPFGSLGHTKKSMQMSQDANSTNYGAQNKVLRSISKSSHVYSNSSWDLVDAQKSKTFELEKVKTAQLPKEMQKMTLAERKAYVKKKQEERTAIQNQIQELGKKRRLFIEAKQSESGGEKSLDASMINAIKKQAIAKGFSFEDDSDGAVTGNLLNQFPNEGTVGVGGLFERPTKPFVSFQTFDEITAQAKKHRATRLIDFKTFVKEGKRKDVIILDTRSKRMYEKLHIKGAVHLNFSDFTQQTLAELIPDTSTKILIYCNNNFSQETKSFRESFATKGIVLSPTTKLTTMPTKTLALNIPTYINLYGYGYKNVYELNELVYRDNKLLELEGTEAFNFKAGR